MSTRGWRAPRRSINSCLEYGATDVAQVYSIAWIRCMTRADYAIKERKRRRRLQRIKTCHVGFETVTKVSDRCPLVSGGSSLQSTTNSSNAKIKGDPVKRWLGTRITGFVIASMSQVRSTPSPWHYGKVHLARKFVPVVCFGVVYSGVVYL